MTTMPAATRAALVAEAAADSGALEAAARPLRSGAAIPLAQHPWLLAALDVVLAAGAMAVAAEFVQSPDGTLGAVLVALWLLCLAATGTFDTRFDIGTGERLRRVLRAGAGLGLLCWVLPLVSGDRTPTSSLVAVVLALLGAGLGTHLGVPLLASRAGVRSLRVVVAGHAAQVEHALRELARLPGWHPEVATVVVTDRPGEDTVREVARVVEEHRADSVVALPGPALPAAQMRRLGWQLEGSGAQLYVGTELLDVSDHRTRATAIAGMRVLHVRTVPAGPGLRIVKELGERAAAALALLLLLPALVGVALAVRLTSPGPAIFRQTRVGRDGRPFTMFKFRTMTTDAERVRDDLANRNECDAVLFKIREDPRITRVGAMLRKYSIDEVPQLLNVVLGDMSLVGPRPALPAEVARYDSDPRRRLAVKPGVTGLWQVSGRSDLTWEESVRLDLRYVDNWSLGLDAAIMLRTVGAVLGRRGAY